MNGTSDPLGSRAGRRPPWALFRAELEAVGFRPTKTLGQNFLVDPNAARSIAEDAGFARGERVLEVGAGCGFLTLHLVELGAEVLAVELDPRLCAVAERLLAGHASVRFLQADVLAGKHRLAASVLAELPDEGRWHLVSNLPYSISAPLLVLLARLPHPPASMTVLVQAEVAARLLAGPGESEWGPLGVRLALGYRARAGRTLAAQLFWPRPRVSSRVVHLARETGVQPSPEELGEFDALVDALFQKRRKQLLSILAEELGERATAVSLLGAAGLDPRDRPERATVGQLLALSRSRGWTGRGRKNPGDR